MSAINIPFQAFCDEAQVALVGALRQTAMHIFLEYSLKVPG